MNLAQEKNINWLQLAIAIIPSLDDHEAHEVMLAIQTHDKMDNPDRYTFGDCRVYMRTQQKCLQKFPKIIPKLYGMRARLLICAILILKLVNLFFPKFEIPARTHPRNIF